MKTKFEVGDLVRCTASDYRRDYIGEVIDLDSDIIGTPYYLVVWAQKMGEDWVPENIIVLYAK